MWDYREFVENQITNESFESQFYSTIQDDIEEMWDYQQFIENHIRNESF